MYFNLLIYHLSIFFLVCLNTKAKILIKDLEVYYPMRSMKGIFANESTMFADYRCLQIFIDYKILYYSEELKERFKTNGKSFNF